METICKFCGHPVTLAGPGGDWIDQDGDSCCELLYDWCGACQDGETHPHLPAAECSRHSLVECSDPDCIRERGGSVLAAEMRDAERWAR